MYKRRGSLATRDRGYVTNNEDKRPDDAADGAEGSSEKAEGTKARIVDAAEEVFGARGYHGSSVVKITKRAGVGLGTFYLYFPSKIEIYRYLLRERQQEFIDAARKGYADAANQRSVLQGAFRAFFDWITARPAILRLLREAEFVDASLGTELYRVPAEEFRSRLAKAVDHGYIETTDPEVLAWCMMGMAEFVTLRWIVWAGKAEMDPERFNAFVEIASRTLGVVPHE